MGLKDIKSMKVLTKKEQKNINGGDYPFTATRVCDIYASASASINADGEHFYQEFYEIYYDIAYDDCINSATVS